MTFLDYEKIFMFHNKGVMALAFYWEIDPTTVRFKYSNTPISRISNCPNMEFVYEHYNKRFLCLK